MYVVVKQNNLDFKYISDFYKIEEKCEINGTITQRYYILHLAHTLDYVH